MGDCRMKAKVEKLVTSLPDKARMKSVQYLQREILYEISDCG